MPPAVTRKEHAGAAAPATLTTSMSVGDMSFSISTNTGWPTGGVGNFYVVIDPQTASEEKILCSLQSTSVVTVAVGGRGADGTTAKSHLSGATVYPVWAAAEADELNAHANASVQVHGLGAADAVVGTATIQTLTNKTISGLVNTITNVQWAALAGMDAEIAALAGLTSQADRLPYFSGSGTAALATFTAAARALLDDADAATMRTTLGAQTLDATLTALAAHTANGLLTQTATDTFTARTLTGSHALVPVSNGDGVAGNPTVGYLGPRGAMVRTITGTTADIGTTETIVFSATFTAEANRIYRVTLTTPVLDNQASAANTAIVTLRWAAGASVTSGGTLIGKATNNVPPTTASSTAGSAAETVTIGGEMNNIAAGQTTVGVGLAALSASSNVRFLQAGTVGPDFQPYLTVWDEGPNL